MALTIEQEPRGLIVVRISGVLKQAEFGVSQKTVAGVMGAGASPNVLAIIENFEGWEKGANWSDLDFLLSENSDIRKIAIVGDPRWEAEVLTFAGAGYRQTPVKFFPADHEAEARNWIANTPAS